MRSSPLNPGRQSGLNRTPTPMPGASTASAAKGKGKQVAELPPALPQSVYGSHQSEYARSRAGFQTPDTLSYETIPLTHSVDNLVPNKPGSSSHTLADLGGAIEMPDRAPARKPRRTPRAIDPSIAAITLKDSPKTREFEKLSQVPLTPTKSQPGSRRSSTDDWGLPLPATAGPAGRRDEEHGTGTIRDQVLAEDAAIRSRTGKIGAVITAGIGTVILGGAAALTYQGAKGKI